MIFFISKNSCSCLSLLANVWIVFQCRLSPTWRVEFHRQSFGVARSGYTVCTYRNQVWAELGFFKLLNHTEFVGHVQDYKNKADIRLDKWQHCKALQYPLACIANPQEKEAPVVGWVLAVHQTSECTKNSWFDRPSGQQLGRTFCPTTLDTAQLWSVSRGSRQRGPHKRDAGSFLTRDWHRKLDSEWTPAPFSGCVRLSWNQFKLIQLQLNSMRSGWWIAYFTSNYQVKT